MRFRPMLSLATACLIVSVVRLEAQTTDGFDPGADAFVTAVALQPNGSIVVAGGFTTFGGSPRSAIARVSEDGVLDSTFAPAVSGIINAVAVQADGKILIGGAFTLVNGAPRNRIARLNADGTTDAAFNPGANNAVQVLTVQPDGKILVGGDFTSIGGGGSGSTPRSRIARLLADGTVDATFDSGATGSSQQVRVIVLQPDGLILVGGAFTALGPGAGTTRVNIGRLLTTGAVDTTFNAGANALVTAIALEPDGQIVVGGMFTMLGDGGIGNTSRSRIGRVSATGAIDLSFDPGAGGTVLALALQADGKILAGGQFGSLGAGGTAVRAFIGRVNADGSADATFDPGAGGEVSALALQANGRVLVGGSFATLGGGGTGTSARANVGRLLNNVAATQYFAQNGSTLTWLRGGSSPDVTRVEFSSSTDGVTFSPLGTATRTLAGDGWELTGLVINSDINLRLRGRAFTDGGTFGTSSSIYETAAPGTGVQTIENADFSAGGTGWLQFALPDMSYIVSNTIGNRMNYYRVAPPIGVPGQAVVFQQTGLPMPPDAPIEASFQLANTDTVRKRISVLIHNASFNDLKVCTFWLPPSAPPRVYSMNTRTTRAWTDATISFYAASANAAGNMTGFFEVDDVTMGYAPLQTHTDTLCNDPTAPTSLSGSTSGNLVTNGDFSSGLAPWGTFGQIDGSVTANEFRFTKLAGTPAGVVLQQTAQAANTNQILETTFWLGSLAGVRGRVTVLVHDSSFTDLAACTFWLEPSQAMTTFRMRSFASQGWTNATVSVYPATVIPGQVFRFDTVSLARTNNSLVSGTECHNDGLAP